MKEDNEPSSPSAAINNNAHTSSASQEGTGTGAKQTDPTAGESSGSASTACEAHIGEQPPPQAPQVGVSPGAEQARETSSSASTAGTDGPTEHCPPQPKPLAWSGHPTEFLWNPERPYLIADGRMELHGDSSWEPWILETAWLQQALLRLDRQNWAKPSTTMFRQQYFIEIAKRTDANLARYDEEYHDIFDILAPHKVMAELLELVAQRLADNERLNREIAQGASSPS